MKEWLINGDLYYREERTIMWEKGTDKIFVNGEFTVQEFGQINKIINKEDAMLKVTGPRYEELTEAEKNNVSDNGSGKEYAGYIRVTHKGETILLESDAMEPEDASFGRDLSWISGIIRKAYEIGKQDGPAT